MGGDFSVPSALGGFRLTTIYMAWHDCREHDPGHKFLRQQSIEVTSETLLENP